MRGKIIRAVRTFRIFQRPAALADDSRPFLLPGVPAWVLTVATRLQAAGHQAFLVGGCVRDRLLGREPKDWDIATDARPEQVQQLFEHTVPTGIKYGTVTVLAPPGTTPSRVEVTTFRRDIGTRDQRHPAEVVFGSSLVDDLARRDFTVNAMAWDPRPGHERLLDPWKGRQDLQRRLIRAVGNPRERFREDALRMLRAVRLAAELGFRLEARTRAAIRREAAGVDALSRERVRDELLRILASPDPQWALWEMQDLGLLFRIIPELEPTYHLPQAKPGILSLLDHLIRTVQHCPPDPILRLAALLHDIGKPATLTVGETIHFHGHEVAGAEIAAAIARRLRLSRAETERIESLIRMHMFSVATVTRKTLRRWLGQYGEEWVRQLIALRRADSLASGMPADEPDPWLDRLEDELNEILHRSEAFRLEDLALGGRDVMRILNLKPGPAVGEALRYLYERVLEDPTLNTPDKLGELLKEYWRNRQSSGEEGRTSEKA
ncbi:MAG: CCA tRNA nucleotidyltransferase [Limnochordales bacterium]|nr:CCA tRNA nucleotidyltransferase [Limnochordales bacterium]